MRISISVGMVPVIWLPAKFLQKQDRWATREEEEKWQREETESSTKWLMKGAAQYVSRSRQLKQHLQETWVWHYTCTTTKWLWKLLLERKELEFLTAEWLCSSCKWRHPPCKDHNWCSIPGFPCSSTHSKRQWEQPGPSRLTYKKLSKMTNRRNTNIQKLRIRNKLLVKAPLELTVL